MKNTIRKTMLRTGTACLALMLALAGCGGATGSNAAAGEAAYVADETDDYAAADSAGSDGYDDYVEYDFYDEEGSLLSVSGSADTARKIITTVDLYMESTSYDRTVHQINDAIESAQGYVEYSDIQGSVATRDQLEAEQDLRMTGGAMLRLNGVVAFRHVNDDPVYVNVDDDPPVRYNAGDRGLTMRIRVPQTGLDGFLGRLEGYGQVLSRQESAEDITLDYVDVESHKKALEAEQERLLDMLSRAESVEDMILLEERLSNVRYQLERYESQLRVYDNLVSYATVNLTLREVVVYTPVEPEPEPTTMQRVAGGMGDTFAGIGRWWTNLFVWFMVNLVYIVCFAAAVAVAVVVGRRKLRKWMPRLRARWDGDGAPAADGPPIWQNGGGEGPKAGPPPEER